jgi:hypothetical protein
MPDEVGAPDGRSIEGAVSGASAAVNSPADAPAPVLKDAGIVLGAVAGTVGDAISDAAIVFGNMAGPAKAPYNPVDTAFGYQDAFWKMLGFRSRPFGAQTSAENAQLGEAFENAMFALLGPGIFAANLPEVDTSGKYSTTIQWGILNLPVRPAGPGFWGPRFPQADPQVDAYELQVNPNNESYYLRLPDGRYAHFENLTDDTLEDAKLVKNSPSIYHVESLPPFASEEMLKKASRQLEAATPHNLKVEWIISDKAAAEQLQALFRRNNLNITVIFLQPRQPWKR